jgi:hypothetical protein
MIIYQGLLTDDEQINTVLVKRYESELLPLLQRKREHLESIFNDLPYVPTMYAVARFQLDAHGKRFNMKDNSDSFPVRTVN